MNLRQTVALVVLVSAPIVLPLRAAGPAAEFVDLDALYRIKQEGLERSRVMETTSYLTDVYGPRLTASPNIRAAGDWAVTTLKEWGLSDVHLETFPFGRGWENRRFSAAAVSPRPFPLIGLPKAWTPGTAGAITGEVVLAVVQAEKDFDAYRGKLRGKFVLTTPMRDVDAHFEAPGRRLTDADLSQLATEPDRARRPRGPADTGRAEFVRRRTKFWLDEGVAALIDPSRGDGGTFFVQSGGSRDPKEPPVPAQVVLAIEHYGRLARLVERHIPVTLRMDIDNAFSDDTTAFNVVAEIRGTDKADDVVMIGAHFDSWHGGTGATDNAAGSAVVMEAMRILKAANLRLRRTVRVALWSGEEQGLLGSKAYVKTHFGDPATMQVTAEHARLSAYFNVDNGTGTIRGVYLQRNEAVAPIFSSWIEPLKNLGMTTLAIRGTGSTDHVSFDAVGLPAFQFVQDPIEYDSRTHHSNMDVYERIQPNDLMHNAVIVAAFAFHAANREEQLPRKPLPPPAPAAN